MSDSIIEQLTETKRLLVESGWCQGRYVGLDGQHCLIGAILVVIPGSEQGKHALQGDEGPARGADLELWNGAPGRTKKQVISMLDEVISLLEKEVTRDA